MAEKVCIVGSGNWGSAIARIVGSNAAANDLFASSVNMWTFEVRKPPKCGRLMCCVIITDTNPGLNFVQEDIDGKKLTEIINTTHENVKYLPGCTLPSNVVAVPDLATAAADATILIFVLPHQFLPRLMPVIKTAMASNARAISLIKGIDFDSSGIRLISQSIATELGVSCSVLMGANVANEVAKDEFSEATIGLSSGCGTGDGDVLRSLFNTDSFSIRVVDDVMGVELCGALKVRRRVNNWQLLRVPHLPLTLYVASEHCRSRRRVRRRTGAGREHEGKPIGSYPNGALGADKRCSRCEQTVLLFVHAVAPFVHP